MTTKHSSNRVNKLKGRPFDEFRCFYIKDFRKGDSIRISSEEGKVRGVVTDVDLNNCLIHYKTSSVEENVTTIDKIVTLEGFIKNFLDPQ